MLIDRKTGGPCPGFFGGGLAYPKDGGMTICPKVSVILARSRVSRSAKAVTNITGR
jgi:hypothetical protein